MVAAKENLDELAINTIRTLSMDGVQKANSGHPGTPMALAPLAYELWRNTLNYDPDAANWLNRDRFVLSNGHASMLLYSTLHLCDVRELDKSGKKTGKPAVSLADLKQFRQLHSKTPGHPEYGHTTGVETTTGPLGQGLANSVGMAMAERWLAARYNRPDHKVFDYNTYAICGDGCFMEGISHEAASLAGHLGLSNLCWFYDNNHITIEGPTSLAYSDDMAARFMGYGWDVTRVGDVNDLGWVRRSIDHFHTVTDKPTLVIVDSHIGYGAPHKQDTASAHGEPLGVDEIKAAKKFYGWPVTKQFFVPSGVMPHVKAGIGKRGKAAHGEWRKTFTAYKKKHPKLAEEIKHIQAGTLPKGWEKCLPTYPADAKGVGSRVSGGEVLNAIAEKIPWFVGGSADLAPSNKTHLKFKGAGSFEKTDYSGHNFHFGIREMGMSAAMNGMAVSHLRPFGGTFFTFSDYARGAIRLSAVMGVPNIYVYTHDSIGVGEDGPTHQPIEHLASLRAMPNMMVMRPCDANEVSEAYKVALNHKTGPTCMVLSRQALPTLDRKKYGDAKGLERGAYVLADPEKGYPDVILIGTGSEVQMCLDAHDALAKKGVRSRVVSMPCTELFDAQPKQYKNRVLPDAIPARVAVEAASPFGWERYVGRKGAVMGMTTFGASAPFAACQKEFGFTVEKLVKMALNQIG